MLNPNFDTFARGLMRGVCERYSKEWSPASELSNEPIVTPLVAPLKEMSVAGVNALAVLEPLDGGLTNEIFSRDGGKAMLVAAINNALLAGAADAYVIVAEAYVATMEKEEFDVRRTDQKAGNAVMGVENLPGMQSAITIHLHVPEGMRLYEQKMADGKPDGALNVYGLDTEYPLSGAMVIEGGGEAFASEDDK